MKFIREFWLAKSKDFAYLGFVILIVYLSITLSGFNEVQSDINLIKYSTGIILGYVIIWIFSYMLDIRKLKRK